ncbi:ribosomal RNA methyltransferase FtsJ domain-containing protein, partial [Protomyces lactucae-debilis]
MVKAAKDKRDIYYRLAKERGFRARSAFKLLQLDEAYNLFTPTTRRVVDLCCAPGSWSQVILQKLKSLSDGNKIGRDDAVLVSVDLQPMAPLDDSCVFLQADITTPSTLKRILEAFSNAARTDLVVSDGAPDVTGMHDLDIYLQHQLLLSALTLATCVLRRGGGFVAKIFKEHDTFHGDAQGGVHGLSNYSSGDTSATLLVAQARLFFERVTIYKPASSRASSLEHFLVCERYSPPADFQPSLDRPLSV